MEAGPSTVSARLSPLTELDAHSLGDDSMDEVPSEASAPLSPNGPFCAYGTRLGYTYFAHPPPTPEELAVADPSTYWLTIDNQLVYLSFFQDTGPLNVAMFYRFALHLHSLLDDEALADKKIVLYSSDAADKKANSALLIALYAMIVLRWSPSDALHPIACLELQPFRDAGYARADFHLSIQDVIFGMKKAIDLRLLRLDAFDVKEYEMYEKVENGDWNYITPHFLAFASPVEHGYVGQPGSGATGNKLPKAFRNVLDHFSAKGVKCVVRLNKKLYAVEHFTERGFEHVEMYFDDGTNPTMDMCREFIALSDRVIKAGGVLAVHCKAGLGRTGTLIGAYMIYKWGFTASEAIGFMRMMRPGSVVGPQQHFLSSYQHTFVRWSAVDMAAGLNGTAVTAPAPQPLERPITPPSDPEPELLVRPSTPTQNPPVPGQPRKTPGRTRHAVAAPETAPEEDAMEGVVSTPPISRDPTPREPTPTESIAAVKAGAVAPPVVVNAGLRPRQRPLSAITDNRIVNRNGSITPPGTSSQGDGRAAGVTRSKAARNLGTLFETMASNTVTAEGSSGERYNLRREGTAARPLASLKSATALRPPPPVHASTSPSRLPQRVPAKRRVASRSGALPSAATGAAHVSTAPPVTTVTTKLTRNVRRRRSSMGAADVMA